jgi:hypothetical protein
MSEVLKPDDSYGIIPAIGPEFAVIMVGPTLTCVIPSSRFRALFIFNRSTIGGELKRSSDSQKRSARYLDLLKPG